MSVIAVYWALPAEREDRERPARPHATAPAARPAANAGTYQAPPPRTADEA